MKVTQTWGKYDNTALLNGVLSDVLTFGATACQDGTIATARTDENGAIFVSIGNGEKIYCEGKAEGLKVMWGVRILIGGGGTTLFESLNTAIQEAKRLQGLSFYNPELTPKVTIERVFVFDQESIQPIQDVENKKFQEREERMYL